MGFTKNKAWCIIIALICLIFFNVVAFVIPITHGLMFWMGYGFAVFANLLLVFNAVIAFGKTDISQAFFNLPSLTVAWGYFALQTFVSIWQMIHFDFPYFIGIITDSALATFAVITLVVANMAKNEIESIDNRIEKKVFYIRELKSDIDLIATTDSDIAERIKDLSESVRFSDPMSHSLLVPIENKIANKISILKENENNPEIALNICDEIQKLIAERNQKCKMLKGMPEMIDEKNNTGVEILAISFAIGSIAAMFALVLAFAIIPMQKYNAAMALYTQKDYANAEISFENLGNYRDSKLKSEQIKEILLDEKYDCAQEYYDSQEYVEALKLYDELGNYKDSVDKAEQIYNKFARGGEIYFGVYKNRPIAWKILDTQSDCMLLITQDPIEKLAFNDELKNITYETSSVRTWLNTDFMEEFSTEQRGRIIKNDDEQNDDIFLLTKEQLKKYGNVPLNTHGDWWLRDKTDAGMMFVYGEDETVNETGESVVRVMGVRPCVWISLK